jgi:transposase InsO family protein
VIHHSDQGYTSIAFGQRCREMGVRPSMGSVGDAYDNALCESFFATLACELLDRHRFHERLLRGELAEAFFQRVPAGSPSAPETTPSEPACTPDLLPSAEPDIQNPGR